MTTATKVKMYRMFERDKNTGLVVKRAERIPEVAEAKVRPCLGCGEPLLIHFGQIKYWHSECRKKGRNRMRREMAGKY
jgi:hypothetical protein